MSTEPIDDLDKAILHLLQVNARKNTNAEIGEKVDVAATTVANRINKMEEEGIITGYHPDINYSRAGLSLYTLFVCTAPVAERRELAERALEIYGVVDVRETMAGEKNVHVETVSQSIEELERVTRELDEVGLAIHRSEILQRHQTRPFNNFGSDLLND